MGRGYKRSIKKTGCANELDDFLILRIEKKLTDAEIAKLDLDLAENSALKNALNNDQELLEVWRDIKHLTTLRDDVEFLKILKDVKNNSALRTHLLGEAYASGKAAGCHWYEAINQGLARKSALNPKGNANPVLYANKGTPNEMEAFWVDIKNSDGIFVPKGANLSTFFPKSWNESKLFEEVAFAVKNKIPTASSSVFNGPTSDGIIKLEITLYGTKIKSVYPSFSNGFKP